MFRWQEAKSFNFRATPMGLDHIKAPGEKVPAESANQWGTVSHMRTMEENEACSWAGHDMVMTNPIILYWICSTSVCNHPVGAPTKPDFFLTWACMTVWEKTIQPSYNITYFQHTRNHTRNTPSKKNTPYRTGKKMVCCAVGKINELVRTARFERSELLRKNNSRVAMKYILGSCRGLCTNFGGDMFGWKESATILFFNEKNENRVISLFALPFFKIYYMTT